MLRCRIEVDGEVGSSLRARRSEWVVSPRADLLRVHLQHHFQQLREQSSQIPHSDGAQGRLHFFFVVVAVLSHQQSARSEGAAGVAPVLQAGAALLVCAQRCRIRSAPCRSCRSCRLEPIDWLPYAAVDAVWLGHLQVSCCRQDYNLQAADIKKISRVWKLIYWEPLKKILLNKCLENEFSNDAESDITRALKFDYEPNGTVITAAHGFIMHDKRIHYLKRLCRCRCRCCSRVTRCGWEQVAATDEVIQA